MRNNTPLVSIIISTYNRAGLVLEAIDSALNQTYKNLEIILIDDGSTDNTKEIITSYIDKIRYFYKTNGGISSARNYGIKQATGEYIAFLDSDDKWFPEKIEKQLDFLLTHRDMEGVLCNVEFISDGKVADKRTNIREFIPEDGMIFKYLIRRFMTMCTVLLRKKIIREIGDFDTLLTTAEDIDMLLRIASRFELGVLDDVLMSIRVTDSGLSGKLYTGNRLKVLEKVRQYAPGFFEANKRMIRSKMAEINLDYAEDLLWHRYVYEARKNISNSMNMHITAKAVLLYIKSWIVELLSFVIPKYKDRRVLNDA